MRQPPFSPRQSRVGACDQVGLRYNMSQIHNRQHWGNSHNFVPPHPWDYTGIFLDMNKINHFDQLISYMSLLFLISFSSVWFGTCLRFRRHLWSGYDSHLLRPKPWQRSWCPLSAEMSSSKLSVKGLILHLFSDLYFFIPDFSGAASHH